MEAVILLLVGLMVAGVVCLRVLPNLCRSNRGPSG